MWIVVDYVLSKGHLWIVITASLSTQPDYSRRIWPPCSLTGAAIAWLFFAAPLKVAVVSLGFSSSPNPIRKTRTKKSLLVA